MVGFSGFSFSHSKTLNCKCLLGTVPQHFYFLVDVQLLLAVKQSHEKGVCHGEF